MSIVQPLPRILFAAPSSASGKTTVTCAVLRALVRRGRKVASFKCGPDYIDPMFHRKSVGTAVSSNLDLFFSDGGMVNRLLGEQARNAGLAVLEGVMGYYDGLAGKSVEASTYAVAEATQTPAVLVVDCRGQSVSVAALVKGFLDFRKDSRISAVVFNRLSPMLYSELKVLVEQECSVAVAGFFPPMPDGALESRHLGLVTADETKDIQRTLDLLAVQAEKTIDLDLLLKLADSAPALDYEKPQIPRLSKPVRIAVADDRAFCFYYQDTLRLLEEEGAELVTFSPLADSALPARIGGLYLGGGYPELYARQLSENTAMRESVKRAVERGVPTIAECGGFLYLHRTLQDAQGIPFPMAGVIDADAVKTEKLSRFGYVTLTAARDNLLCRAGESLPAHEFHYWDSDSCGNDFTAQKPLRSTGWECVHAKGTLWAGFPHLYLPAVPKAAYRFLKAAETYRKDLQNDAE